MSSHLVGSTALEISSYGNGTGMALLEDLTSTGDEARFIDCAFNETEVQECGNFQTLEVRCGTSSNSLWLACMY